MNSVEVNILKENSVKTDEENCHDVLEETDELSTNSDKKEQCLTEDESLPSQKLGPFEPTQRSHDSHLSQQIGDIREAGLQDEQGHLPKTVVNDCTSVNGDLLVKLQQWKIDGNRPGSSDKESTKNDHHSVEEYGVINLSAGSSLKDSCTDHHSTNNTMGLDMYKNENVSQILTEGHMNRTISALHDSTCISSGSTNSNGSCHQETNSEHDLLPSAVEFDRDFSDYLQSAQSFLVSRENDCVDKSELPVPWNCVGDHKNQLCDTDSASNASSNLCYIISDVARLGYCKKDDSVILGNHSQRTDAPFNQHQNYCNKPVNLEQTANRNTCCFNLPVQNTEKYNFFEYSQSLWNWDSQLASSCHLHPFADGFGQPHNLHGNHCEGLSLQNWTTCGCSPNPPSETGYAAMPPQDREDTRHECQWNASWYYAYWRQTNFLRQFLCYRKSCRF